MKIVNGGVKSILSETLISYFKAPPTGAHSNLTGLTTLSYPFSGAISIGMLLPVSNFHTSDQSPTPSGDTARTLQKYSELGFSSENGCVLLAIVS